MATVNAAVASGVVRPPSSARLGSHVLEDELAHRQYAVNWNRAVDAASRGADRRRHARYGTIRGRNHRRPVDRPSPDGRDACPVDAIHRLATDWGTAPCETALCNW